MTNPRVSLPIEAKIENVIGVVMAYIVGLLFISAGFAWVWYEHRNAATCGHAENTLYTYLGLGIAVLGAAFMPSLINPILKIYVTVFPSGLPLIGGRRVTDPTTPPEPPAGS